MKLRIFRTLIACASIFTISTFADATNAPVRVQRSVADVVKLSKGRVSGEVLLLYIKNNRAGYSLSADEILYLKEQNVPAVK